MLHPPTIVLGGKTRTLICDIGALAALEDLGHEPMALIDRVAEGKGSFKQILALITAMLWRDGVTSADVGAWVTMDRFVEVSQKVGAALRYAFASGEASEEANPPSGGTGDTSSSLVPSAV